MSGKQKEGSAARKFAKPEPASAPGNSVHTGAATTKSQAQHSEVSLLGRGQEAHAEKSAQRAIATWQQGQEVSHTKSGTRISSTFASARQPPPQDPPAQLSSSAGGPWQNFMCSLYRRDIPNYNSMLRFK